MKKEQSVRRGRSDVLRLLWPNSSSPTIILRLPARARMWLAQRRITITILVLYSLIALGLMSPVADKELIDVTGLTKHVSMVVEARNALAEGQFPIRVAPNQQWGFRYPFF